MIFKKFWNRVILYDIHTIFFQFLQISVWEFHEKTVKSLFGSYRRYMYYLELKKPLRVHFEFSRNTREMTTYIFHTPCWKSHIVQNCAIFKYFLISLRMWNINSFLLTQSRAFNTKYRSNYWRKVVMSPQDFLDRTYLNILTYYLVAFARNKVRQKPCNACLGVVWERWHGEF